MLKTTQTLMSYELSTSDDDDLSSLELEDEDFYTDDLR